jgi:hypothetical protein
MIRWIFLIASIGAVAVLFGVEPKYPLYSSFVVLCINFATFCLQFDDAVNRARQRVNSQLSRLGPAGLHAEEYQRLQSATLKTTVDDRATRYGPMTIANIVSGLAGIGFLLWGIVLRIT